MKGIAVLVLCFLQLACSGGNQAHTTAGVWQGTITSEDSEELKATAVTTSDGEISIIVADNVYFNGHLSVDEGGGFKSEGQSFCSTLEGDFIPGNSIIGRAQLTDGNSTSEYCDDLKFRNPETGRHNDTLLSINLAYDPIYERTSSLSNISGIYTYSDENITLTYAIQDDGSLHGDDSQGCIYDGSVAVSDNRYNYYKVNLSISNCGVLGEESNTASHEVSGSAVLLDDSGVANDILMFTGLDVYILNNGSCNINCDNLTNIIYNPYAGLRGLNLKFKRN